MQFHGSYGPLCPFLGHKSLNIPIELSLAGSSSASEGANLQSFATTVLFIVSGTFWVFFTDIYDSISRMADFTVCQGISSIIGNRYFLVRQLQL